MYICLCYGVTEHTLKQEIQKGATTVSELVHATGAGMGCGKCVASMEQMLSGHAKPFPLLVFNQEMSSSFIPAR